MKTYFEHQMGYYQRDRRGHPEMLQKLVQFNKLLLVNK
jgi:hypothetical protein